jgi:hypothetical protein
MKFWTVPVILLVLTLTAQAQIPIYGAYPYLQSYYPGAYAPAYYPQAYYLQAYSSQSYIPTPFVQTPYVQTPYVPPPAYWPYPMATFAVPDNTAKVDTLTKQVQDLNDEVKLLQSELTVRQTLAYSPQPQALARVGEVPPREPSPSMVLVLKRRPADRSSRLCHCGRQIVDLHSIRHSTHAAFKRGCRRDSKGDARRWD